MTEGRIAVVGCGSIGAGWAAWFLARGRTVACVDPAAGAEARLRAAVARDFAMLGLAGQAAADALERLSFTTRLDDAVAGCGWVQENAPEDLAVKRAVIGAVDAATDAEVVIASSTSGIMPSALQQGMRHPERIVAAHPFLPVPLIALVEVAGGAGTSEATMDAAMRFYAGVGKAPIRLRREMVGHIANRLQAALMREAFHLLQQGVASAADIDRAVTDGPGQRWAATGPFTSQELAGGPGGAAAAFANLGDAMRAMWADLGSPVLDAALEAQVRDGIDAMMADVPPAEWQDRRIAVLSALARAKAGPGGAAGPDDAAP